MKLGLQIMKLILGVAVCATFAACAGVRCQVIAPQVVQPVSMTPAVLDPSGNILTAGAANIVSHFRFRLSNWAMFWSLIPLSSKVVDLSGELNGLLAQHQGDAVVNLTVLTQGDWWWYFTSILPIIPDYQWIVIEGDIARFPKGTVAK